METLKQTEFLSPSGGIELVRVGFDNPGELNDSNTLRYHTFLVNSPNHNGIFIPFSSVDAIMIPSSQTTGKMGDISIALPHQHQTAYMSRFFPFSALPEKYPFLLKKGLGTKIQTAVAQDLLKVLGPDYKMVHLHPSENYTKLLQRLGIQPKQLYPLAEYVHKIVEHN